MFRLDEPDELETGGLLTGVIEARHRQQLVSDPLDRALDGLAERFTGVFEIDSGGGNGPNPR